MPVVTPTRQGAHLQWIDVCKGIGIIAVVIGHTVGQWQLVQVLFLFHMPLFFFLSGYLHRPEQRLGLYLRRKAIHLLLPYLSFLLILSPLAIHNSLRHGGMIRQVVVNCIFGGVRLGGSLSIFWFVTCLFITQQVANLVLAKCTGLVVAVIAILSIVSAYVTAAWFHVWQIPWDANVVLASLPMFLAGSGYRKMRESRLATAVAIVIALTGAVLVCRGIGLAYDMRDAHYGNAFVTPALSLAWILSIFSISQSMSSWPAIAPTLASLGRRSMGIMFLHEAVSLPLLHWHIGSGWLVACGALTGSYILTVLIARNTALRLLFLGEEPGKSRTAPEIRTTAHPTMSGVAGFGASGGGALAGPRK